MAPPRPGSFVARASRSVAAAFSLVLLATGALGFLAPDASMSTSPAYNAFHLVFGALGLGAAALGGRAPAAFNLGFGLLDLYQAWASYARWFPLDLFRWRPLDDTLHIILGTALALVGLLGLVFHRRTA